MSSTRGSVTSSNVLLLDGEDEAAPDRSQGVIQICPHQELTWERFHNIANLPNSKTVIDTEEALIKLSKNQAKDVGALTKLSEHHGLAKKLREINAKLHLTPSPPSGHYIKAKNLRGCSVKTSEIGVHVLGTAIFTYDSEEMEQSGGFVLNTIWTLETARIRGPQSSKEKLAKRLEKTGIWLCSHTRLSDPLMVQRSWERLHPSENAVAIHEADQDDGVQDWCKTCQTEVTVMYIKDWRMPAICFWSKRYLGEGQSPNDPKWQQQCGLPTSEREI